jgi:PD-(D/E)XK nuclease superfamily protein
MSTEDPFFAEPGPLPVSAEHTTPGRQATKNGEALEHAVLARLARCGYEQRKSMPIPCTAAFFIHRWRGGLRSVIDTAMVPDFYIWHPSKYPEGCLVECKWQETAGSAEAKIKLVIESLVASPYRAIVILNGPGFSRRYLEYYKSLENERLTVITSSDELMVRINRGLF